MLSWSSAIWLSSFTLKGWFENSLNLSNSISMILSFALGSSRFFSATILPLFPWTQKGPSRLESVFHLIWTNLIVRLDIPSKNYIIIICYLCFTPQILSYKRAFPIRWQSTNCFGWQFIIFGGRIIKKWWLRVAICHRKLLLKYKKAAMIFAIITANTSVPGGNWTHN